MNLQDCNTAESLRREWVNQYANDFDRYLTLTYRNEVKSVLRVNRDLKTLAKHMRAKAYGQHALKYAEGSIYPMMIGGIERHASGSIHIHMLLHNPPKSAQRAIDDQILSNYIERYVTEFWERKGWGHQTHYERLLAESDRRKCLGYCLKYSTGQNQNNFLFYWDNSAAVLPESCLR